MNSIMIFNYSAKQVRTVMQNGEPWWVLKDVCGILEVGNSRDVAARLDDDEKAAVDLIDTSSNGTTQSRSVTVVNEPGLYNVILRSDKPEAKAFKRWVTHEVLPAIRKTGAYSLNTDDPEMLNAATRYLGTIIRVMRNQKSPAKKIAKETELVCQQYSLPLIPDFVEQSKYEQLMMTREAM